jgi:hypothetical protein
MKLFAAVLLFLTVQSVAQESPTCDVFERQRTMEFVLRAVKNDWAVRKFEVCVMIAEGVHSSVDLKRPGEYGDALDKCAANLLHEYEKLQSSPASRRSYGDTDRPPSTLQDLFTH